MKKRVSSSNLALRFYKSDGWTIEELESYLVSGYFLDTEVTHGDPHNMAYYVLNVHSCMDMKKFYVEKVSEVQRAFNDYPNMTDLEFLESMNW